MPFFDALGDARELDTRCKLICLLGVENVVTCTLSRKECHFVLPSVMRLAGADLETIFVPEHTLLNAPIIVQHDDRVVILTEPILVAREVNKLITLMAREEW